MEPKPRSRRSGWRLASEKLAVLRSAAQAGWDRDGGSVPPSQLPDAGSSYFAQDGIGLTWTLVKFSIKFGNNSKSATDSACQMVTEWLENSERILVSGIFHLSGS